MAGDAPPIDIQRERLIAAPPAKTSRVKTLLNLLLVVIDVIALCVAFALGHAARMVVPLFDIPPSQPVFLAYIPVMILHTVTVIGLLYISQLYHLPRAISRIDQARSILGAVTIGTVLASGMQELIFKNSIFEVDYPRSMFFWVWFFSAVTVLVGREIHYSLRRFLRKRGIDRDNLLIVGMGKIARDIAGRIKAQPELGYYIVGVVNGEYRGKDSLSGVPVIGTYDELPELIDAYAVEQVIIALPDAQRTELVDLINLSQRGRVDIKVYPDMFAYMAGDMSVKDLGGTPLLTVRDIALRGWKLSLKRGLDIVGSLLGLIFLSPLMLLTALLVHLESAGPVFYWQERMGLDGRPFPMIKFRSMRMDAESAGPGWTVENDPRVTKLGRLMRRTNWDEIPQLINVAAGHMSLVGPRPERPVYVQEFRERIPRYMQRHREKAGMTGWAQVNGLRGDTSIAERTAYDLWYVENWSLWLDIKIIIRTVFRMVMRKDTHAY
ncbi:MAG: undecaprenyl-phosphate glucose phosphotransferase [Burkholderiales bacterium]|nr:undecaprenyl-phosphate glucose phosphotransferase [Anaerolineae bacterium]